MRGAAAVGVDVGGTKILAGLVDAAGRVLESRRWPTRREHYLEDVLRAADAGMVMAANHGVGVVGIGLGTTGFVDHDAGVLLRAMNLGVEETDLRQPIEERCGLPVAVDNDMHAATLGELLFGVGRDHREFLYLNAGTGIAAGLVIGGRLHRGVTNAAGEAGHFSADQHGVECQCGLAGCLEASVLALRHGCAAPDVRLQRAASPPPDPAYAYLALAAVQLVNLLNPSALVLAGGMFSESAAGFDWVRRTVPEVALEAAAAGLRAIERPAAGPMAGLVGAAALAFERSGVPLEKD